MHAAVRPSSSSDASVKMIMFSLLIISSSRYCICYRDHYWRQVLIRTKFGDLKLYLFLQARRVKAE